MARPLGSKNRKSDAKEAFLGVIADKLSPQDIEQMLAKIRGTSEPEKTEKSSMISETPNYNVLRVKNLLKSIEKHVDALLVVVHKIQDENAPEGIYDLVNEKIQPIQISSYRLNASTFSYEPRISRGGRKKKVTDGVAA